MQVQASNEVKRAETRIVVFKAGTTCLRCMGSGRKHNAAGTDIPCWLCQGTGNAIREDHGMVALYSQNPDEIAGFEAQAFRRWLASQIDRIVRWPILRINRLFTICRFHLTGFQPGSPSRGGQ